MPTTYARPTYKQILQSILEQMNRKEELAALAPETLMVWELEAAQQITQRLRIEEKRTLRLVQGVEDYTFQDTTGTITGTGTVSTSGVNLTGVTAAGTGTISVSITTVTGVGTTFVAQLQAGMMITVAGESHEILSIQSNTSLTLKEGFTATVAGAAFTYSTTKFTRELVTGSSVTVDSQTAATVASVTDGQTAVLTAPLATDQSNKTFTIDTVVTEIPTRLRDGLYYIDRTESSFKREVKIKPMNYLLTVTKNDLYPVYTGYNTPFMAAVWRDSSGHYYLHVYPAPDATKEITLYAVIKITPRLYLLTDTLDSQMPLDEDYEPMIRAYTEAMAWGWIKEYEQKNQKMKEFYGMITDMKRLGRGPAQMIVSYQ